MRRISGSALFWAIVCAVAMSVYLLATEVTPFFSSTPGFVPSPVQTANVRRGNDYVYYITTIREFAEWDWPPEAPTNSGTRTYERARIIPIAVGALPYLLTDDTRLVLLLDYVLIAFGLAIPAYLVSRLVTGRPVLAAALTLFALTYSVVWSNLPFQVDLIGLRWPGVSRDLLRSISLLMDPPDKAAIGEHFRVVQPALSIPFSLTFLLLILKLRLLDSNRARVGWGLLAVTLGIVLFFTYTPVTVAGYLFIVSAAGASFLLREWRNFVTYVAIGIAIIALLELLGIPQFVVNEMASNALLSRLFQTSSLINWQPDLKVIWNGLSSKYILLSFFLIPLVFVSRELRFAILVACIMGVLLTLAQIFIADRNLAIRMGRRAADVQWFLLYVSVAAGAVANLSARLKVLPACGYGGLVAFLVLMTVPVWGQVRAFISTFGEASYRLQSDDYALLGYLQQNYAQDTVVATLDWRLIQLIGMFTDLDPAVSDIALSARAPEVEMPRLVALYKAFGLSKTIYLADVELSIESAEKMVEPVARAYRTGIAASYRQTPYIDWKNFRSAAIAQYILLYRTLPDYGGITLRQGDRFSDELLKRLSLDWDTAPDCAPWILSDVRLVVWDSSTSPLLDWKCPGKLIPIRQYGTLALYALSDDEGASGN